MDSAMSAKERKALEDRAAWLINDQRNWRAQCNPLALPPLPVERALLAKLSDQELFAIIDGRYCR